MLHVDINAYLSSTFHCQCLILFGHVFQTGTGDQWQSCQSEGSVAGSVACSKGKIMDSKVQALGTGIC